MRDHKTKSSQLCETIIAVIASMDEETIKSSPDSLIRCLVYFFKIAEEPIEIVLSEVQQAIRYYYENDSYKFKE